MIGTSGLASSGLVDETILINTSYYLNDTVCFLRIVCLWNSCCVTFQNIVFDICMNSLGPHCAKNYILILIIQTIVDAVQ